MGRREHGKGGVSSEREEEGGKKGEGMVRKEGEGRKKESRGMSEEGEMERGTRQKRKKRARAEG